MREPPASRPFAAKTGIDKENLYIEIEPGMKIAYLNTCYM